MNVGRDIAEGNASAFRKFQVEGRLTVFASHPMTEFPAMNISEALHPASWRDRFEPFAFVIVDNETGERALVRDHMGVAPLYYRLSSDGKLVFGDNLPDVLKHLPSVPPLNEAQIRALFLDTMLYSDETLYEGIHRVEPGHLIRIKPNGLIEKKVFWRLELEGDTIRYGTDEEYLEHFSELMREAIKNATRNSENLAAEYSAGIDSTAVYCAAREQGVDPKLYMHAERAELKSPVYYNDRQEKFFVEYFSPDLVRVVTEDFDSIAVLEECAEWFGGPAPFIFFMFAHGLYREIAAGKHSIVLSGFGGDQGVSAPAPLQFYLPALIHQRDYREAWQEIRSRNPIFRAGKYALHSHPLLYQAMVAGKKIKRYLRRESALPSPYYTRYFRSLREVEWNFLQGPFSNEIRMRVEYSSVMSKKFGFEYRYPLLYPKLLEFFVSLPPRLKRRDGNGRYLIRRYLAKFLPAEIFDSYKKREGLSILPSTFRFFQQEYERGKFQNEFSELPYPKLVRDKQALAEMRKSIKAYMLKATLTRSGFQGNNQSV